MDITVKNVTIAKVIFILVTMISIFCASALLFNIVYGIVREFHSGFAIYFIPSVVGMIIRYRMSRWIDLADEILKSEKMMNRESENA